MTEKKRYLIGHSESAVVPQDTDRSLEEYFSKKRVIKKVRKLKTGQHIVEMTEEEVLKLSQEHPHLLIEKDEELELFSPMPGLTPSVPSDSSFSLSITVTDKKTKKPVKDATVYCLGEEVSYKGLTDDKGVAVVTVFEKNIKNIITSPKDTHWSKVIPAPKIGQKTEIKIELQHIELQGDYDWGASLLGLTRPAPAFTGKGIKVAVIDSGIHPHEDLSTQGGFNTLDGQDPESWNVDEKGHGTHCCGIIASQNNEIGTTGIAPEAEIYSLKVFPGGRLSDLIEAVNWCIEHYIDVVSMSLGGKSHSAHLENVLKEANDRGITCVAASGNHAGPVAYPAAFENVIAVSAIGKLDSFPEDSGHSLKISDYLSHDEQLFFANFSNFGPEIDICAPGVAILSTVPTGYASWDGTSMACPIIAGIAALILEAYPDIKTGDAWQPYYVHEILASSSRDIGLPPEMQGAGLPDIDAALADASYQYEYEKQITASYHQYLDYLLQRAKRCTDEIEEALVQLNTD